MGFSPDTSGCAATLRRTSAIKALVTGILAGTVRVSDSHRGDLDRRRISEGAPDVVGYGGERATGTARPDRDREAERYPEIKIGAPSRSIRSH